jgi:hypothetical protein
MVVARKEKNIEKSFPVTDFVRKSKTVSRDNRLGIECEVRAGFL